MLCVCDCIPDNILQEHLCVNDRQLSWSLVTRSCKKITTISSTWKATANRLQWAELQDFSCLEMSNLENSTGLFVDKTWDTLDTSSASQSPDGWLSDTLDVVTEHLPVTLCASLAKTFATFASARHSPWLVCVTLTPFEIDCERKGTYGMVCRWCQVSWQVIWPFMPSVIVLHVSSCVHLSLDITCGANRTRALAQESGLHWHTRLPSLQPSALMALVYVDHPLFHKWFIQYPGPALRAVKICMLCSTMRTTHGAWKRWNYSKNHARQCAAHTMLSELL